MVSIDVIPSGKGRDGKIMNFLQVMKGNFNSLHHGEKQILAMRGGASSGRNSLKVLNHCLGDCNCLERQEGNLPSLPLLLKGFALYDIVSGNLKNHFSA